MTRRGVLLGAALLSMLLSVRGAAMAQAADPATPVAALNAALIAAMRAGRATPFAARAAQLRPVIEQTFDLDAVLRASVGGRFAALPPADQAPLRAAFVRYTVATYTANFDSFDGQRFTILPATRAVGADRVVATTIQPPGDAAVRLDYVMRSTASGWRAVDVLADGSISNVAVQRSDFRALVADGAAPLIARLNAKAAALEAGSKS